MLLDQDFDIIENVSDSVKFVGHFRVVFTSNIYQKEVCTSKNGASKNYLVANANVIIEGTDTMYRCYIEFPAEDIIRHSSYNGTYWLPIAYNGGQRTTHGTRLKGFSFEIDSVLTNIDRYKRYNSRTGQFETTSYYRISVKADTLKKIENLDTTPYQLIMYDKSYEDTVIVEDTPLSFDGHHKIQFTSGIYRKNVITNHDIYSEYYFANAVIADVKVAFIFNGFEMNVIEASRWCPYTAYRPVISGKGATLKGHTFDLDVVDTQVTTRYTYDEERQVSIAKHSYVLVINPKTITRVRQKRNAA